MRREGSQEIVFTDKHLFQIPNMDNVSVVATVADAWSSGPDVVAKLLTRAVINKALKTSHCPKGGLLHPRRE